MIRYLIVLVFVSCNSSQEKATPIAVNKTDSSLQLMIDSISLNVDSIGTMTESVENKVARLERENANMARDLGEKSPTVHYVQRDALVASNEQDYSSRIEELEKENARLRKRIATDSTYIARMNKTGSPIEEIEKPNPNSLIVQPVPSNNIDVYLIPYSKKAKKKLMVYEAACDLSLINDLGGKLSSNYKGQHFFNDVLPGKYIVKLCTYFGNYQVIERTQDKQVIVMATSPPIK